MRKKLGLLAALALAGLLIYQPPAYAPAGAVYDQASDIVTDTDNFDGNLSGADDTVQKALETLDETAGGSGTVDDDVTVNSTAVDTTAEFTDNLYIDFSLTDGGAGGPDTVVPKFNYAETLAGNPALLVDECVFFKGTGISGFLCEGTTADTSEYVILIPLGNPADTTNYFALGASDGDALAGDSIVSFFPAFTVAELATELSDEDYTPGSEAGVEAAIDTLANLTSIQSLTVTLADAGANAFFGWDDAASAYENLTAAEALAVLEASINILLETEIDASSELAALMDDETGSGALMFGTTPTITTSYVFDSITVAGYITEAEGISSNDNDTTIPTSAAVKAYADSVGGGSGDVESVGDGAVGTACASGACGDGSSDAETAYSLYDGDSNKGTFTTANLSADRVYTFGNLALTFDQSVASGAAPTFDAGNFTGIPAGAFDNDAVDSADIAAGAIDFEHMAADYISGAAAVGTFESGDTFPCLEAGVGLRECDFDDLPSAGSDTNSVKEYWWPASALLPLEAADSVPPISKDTGTNVDTLVRLFDSSTEECATASFKVPSDVQSGSTVTFRTIWYSDTTSGNVVWDFRHTGGDTEGEDWDSALTTVAAAADAVAGTLDQLTVTTWTETLANLGWAANDLVSGATCRDSDNGSDTMDSNDAFLFGFGVEMHRA